MSQEGYWSVTVWNRRVLPKLQYGDNIGLSPQCLDLIFNEAFT